MARGQSIEQQKAQRSAAVEAAAAAKLETKLRQESVESDLGEIEEDLAEKQLAEVAKVYEDPHAAIEDKMHAKKAAYEAIGDMTSEQIREALEDEFGVLDSNIDEDQEVVIRTNAAQEAPATAKAVESDIMSEDELVQLEGEKAFSELRLDTDLSAVSDAELQKMLDVGDSKSEAMLKAKESEEKVEELNAILDKIENQLAANQEYAKAKDAATEVSPDWKQVQKLFELRQLLDFTKATVAGKEVYREDYVNTYLKPLQKQDEAEQSKQYRVTRAVKSAFVSEKPSAETQKALDGLKKIDKEIATLKKRVKTAEIAVKNEEIALERSENEKAKEMESWLSESDYPFTLDLLYSNPTESMKTLPLSAWDKISPTGIPYLAEMRGMGSSADVAREYAEKHKDDDPELSAKYADLANQFDLKHKEFKAYLGKLEGESLPDSLTNEQYAEQHSSDAVQFEKDPEASKRMVENKKAFSRRGKTRAENFEDAQMSMLRTAVSELEKKADLETGSRFTVDELRKLFKEETGEKYSGDFAPVDQRDFEELRNKIESGLDPETNEPYISEIIKSEVIQGLKNDLKMLETQQRFWNFYLQKKQEFPEFSEEQLAELEERTSSVDEMLRKKFSAPTAEERKSIIEAQSVSDEDFIQLMRSNQQEINSAKAAGNKEEVNRLKLLRERMTYGYAGKPESTGNLPDTSSLKAADEAVLAEARKNSKTWTNKEVKDLYSGAKQEKEDAEKYRAMSREEKIEVQEGLDFDEQLNAVVRKMKGARNAGATDRAEFWQGVRDQAVAGELEAGDIEKIIKAESGRRNRELPKDFSGDTEITPLKRNVKIESEVPTDDVEAITPLTRRKAIGLVQSGASVSEIANQLFSGEVEEGFEEEGESMTRLNEEFNERLEYGEILSVNVKFDDALEDELLADQSKTGNEFSNIMRAAELAKDGAKFKVQELTEDGMYRMTVDSPDWKKDDVFRLTAKQLEKAMNLGGDQEALDRAAK